MLQTGFNLLVGQIISAFLMGAETPKLFWDENESKSIRDPKTAFLAFLVGIFSHLSNAPSPEDGATLANLSSNSISSRA